MPVPSRSELARSQDNAEISVFASAARTATHNSQDYINYGATGLALVIDVTAVTATPSVVFTIQGKDTLSGKYFTILDTAAITGTGTTRVRVHPGMTASANVVVKDAMPRVWRVLATHADADSITYSVGASPILW